MRPSPYQAFVQNSNRLRQILHVLHRAAACAGRNRADIPTTSLPKQRNWPTEGCREITLLGQTVNSYRHTDGDRTTRLSDLLYRLHDIDGLKRLKFVTNFPKDMTDDLLQAVRDLPKCSPYLHVPAQSGSNAVLKRMKRGYTVEEYREMLQPHASGTIPEAAVTSDFIVGFCGETEEDFQQTVELVRESRFKNSFIFKYSERPGTKAPEFWPDDVPEEVKRRRNNELLAVQNRDQRGRPSTIHRSNRGGAGRRTQQARAEIRSHG